MLYPVKVRVKFSFRSQCYKNTKVTVHFNRGETLSGAMNVLKNLVPGLEYEVRFFTQISFGNRDLGKKSPFFLFKIDYDKEFDF